MKGLSLTTKDLQRSDNPLWREAAGGLPDAKPRAKRFNGPTSQSKAWAREMSKGPGRFFQTGRIINWLNSSMHKQAQGKIAKVQRHSAQMETAALMAGNMIRPPYVVSLCRYGPKLLDDIEAVSASLKHYRDGVADWLGLDDSGRDSLRFEYDQKLSLWEGKRLPVYGLRIEIREDRR